MGQFFDFLASFEDMAWSCFGFPAIIAMGLYLTYKSRFVQLRHFPHVVKTFLSLMFRKEKSANGIHPIKAFFACVGGCVGIGNIVGVTTAVQLGGPGAVFWIWITAMAGALIKYAEVYLGMRYRVASGNGGYLGGPMYFFAKAFSNPFIVKLFCVLMCLYGVEVFQFSVMAATVSENFGVSKLVVSLSFLALVIIAEIGGLKRISTICSAIIPFFIVVYLGMGFYVLACNITSLPTVIVDILHYAFTPHAAFGAFIGSTMMSSISQGIRRACYSCDIGVGYASIIHSESSVENPAHQASLTIFEVFLDTFIICTMSLIIVLVTGTWAQDIAPIYLVQNALSNYFPYMNLFLPVLLFLLGYSTIITYFCSGMKTATFLSPKYGRRLYYLYAVIVLLLFSFVDTAQANSVMSCVLVLLLGLNLAAIWRLRHELQFDFAPEASKEALTQVVLAD